MREQAGIYAIHSEDAREYEARGEWREARRSALIAAGSAKAMGQTGRLREMLGIIERSERRENG